MEGYAVLVGNLTDGDQVVEGPGFVIGRHDANQTGVPADGLLLMIPLKALSKASLMLTEEEPKSYVPHAPGISAMYLQEKI